MMISEGGKCQRKMEGAGSSERRKAPQVTRQWEKVQVASKHYLDTNRTNMTVSDRRRPDPST